MYIKELIKKHSKLDPMKTKNLQSICLAVLLLLLSNGISAQEYTEWNGAIDEDWNKPDNWNGGIVPDATLTAIIPDGTLANFPDLTDDSGECQEIVLSADANGPSSILGNENLVADYAQVDTYITTGQWHMISPPVYGETASLFHFPGIDTYLTYFDEPSNSYVYITDVSTPLYETEGYMLWIEDPDALAYLPSYFGDLNYGYYETDFLTRSAPGPDNGWNMVGNPYPSTIDWDAENGWYKLDIDETIYIINDGLWASWSASGGSTNGGSNYIASGQGFFVSVTDDGSTEGYLEMEEEIRVNSSEQFLKKTRELTDYVKLTTSGNGRTDEIIIRFLEGSSTSFEGQYDAYKKLTTSEEIPQIYTQTDVKYAVNVVPTAESLPLYFLCGQDGVYSISIVEIKQIDDVWLEDLTTGGMVNLKEEDYVFNYETSDDPARFMLHFSLVDIPEEKPESIHVYSYQNQINIQSPDMMDGEFRVLNLLGQTVVRGYLSGTEKQLTIYQKGTYLIRLKSNGSMLTRKIIIN